MNLSMFFVVLFLGSVLSEDDYQNPTLELYSEYEYDGELRTVKTSESSLGSFNNLASSLCVHGLFILHEQEDFNDNLEKGLAFWAWSRTRYCMNVFDYINNRASSVRYVGDEEDIRKSTLSFYKHENFGGERSQYKRNYPRTDKDRSSAIVTGTEPWTLYDETDYEGSSICIYPGDYNHPGFYPSTADLGSFAGRVRSVKRGCHSDSEMHPPASFDEETDFMFGSFDV